MSNYTLEDAQEYFKKDRFATDAGVKLVALSEEESEAEMVLTDAHKNAYGGVMGGAIFTLADYTFAVSSNFNQPQTVSITSQINFIGMAKGKKLISESRLIKDGRSTCLYEIDITDELGTKIALATFTGMKLNQAK